MAAVCKFPLSIHFDGDKHCAIGVYRQLDKYG
jgi:hypothetical protein